MRSKFAVFILLLVGITFSSCGDPTAPEDLLEEDRYIEVFSELVVINQIREDQLDGVSRDYLKEQVFEEYGVTQQQFEQTHRYYQQQPEEHLQRLDKIEQILTEQRDIFQDRLNEDRKQLADSLMNTDSVSVDTLTMPHTDFSTINSEELMSNEN